MSENAGKFDLSQFICSECGNSILSKDKDGNRVCTCENSQKENIKISKKIKVPVKEVLIIKPEKQNNGEYGESCQACGGSLVEDNRMISKGPEESPEECIIKRCTRCGKVQ